MDQAAMLEIRNRLQAIEDELVATGFDEFIVACDAGTFTWKTVRAGPRRAWRRAAAGRLCVAMARLRPPS
jgi:hypothetical protein